MTYLGFVYKLCALYKFEKKPAAPGKETDKNRPPRQALPCQHCKKQGHPVYTCEAFKALSSKERYNSVRENNLCLRCLGQGHIARDCKMKFLCDVDKCGRRHNRLLHPDRVSRAMFQLFSNQKIDSDLDSDEEQGTTNN